MPHALVLYHFFYPDDVVSSRLLSDLAAGLAERGWKVIARPSNRSCRDESRKYALRETAQCVRIDRVWRPAFRQARPIGRLLNTVWMLSAWSLSACRFPAPDVVIIGTDPILSVLVAIPWKVIHPKTKAVHWCFDLYPEAAVADGALATGGTLLAVLRRLLRWAYSCCDAVIDIGPCMRELFAKYGSSAQCLTITPWALAEPPVELRPDPSERNTVFGDVKLAVMYSGSFGRAHSYEEVLSVARAVRGKSIRFAFSIRGNRTDELRRAVSEQDKNVTFVPFAAEERLEARLSAADIHIVTLREEWTGSVVPSKFFGALAAGRPILFVGSRRSSIARWIEQYQVGWVLERANEPEIITELCHLAEHPGELAALFAHCHHVYQRYFSRTQVIDRLEGEIRNLITAQKSEEVASLSYQVRSTSPFSKDEP